MAFAGLDGEGAQGADPRAGQVGSDPARPGYTPTQPDLAAQPHGAEAQPHVAAASGEVAVHEAPTAEMAVPQQERPIPANPVMASPAMRAAAEHIFRGSPPPGVRERTVGEGNYGRRMSEALGVDHLIGEHRDPLAALR
ncbi:hypothetical protein, partial [Nocardia sp. NPDC004722]